MSDKPFFSILIPTYNQAQYLGAALDSAIAQTYTNWEAIIINDGSTDATAEIIEIYCNKDPRFKAIHKENGGVGSALNKGLENAKGEWICWLSSDDLFEPNKLEIHQKWISDFPDYKFFFSNFRQLVGTSGKITNLNPTLSQEIPPLEIQIIHMLKRNYVAGNSICVSKDAWLDTGWFDEGLRYAQDYDMWIRLMIKYPAIYIPEYTYLQRIYPEQESQRFSYFCLYDSAKSTIKILNKYELKNLLPLVQLDKNDLPSKLVNIILDITFDQNSFTYQFGFHPLLILRVKQFIDQNNISKKELDFKFYKQLNFNRRLFTNTPKGMWCEFSRKIMHNLPHTLDWSFSLSFTKLGENNYWWLHYIESDLQQSVLTYLHKFCDHHFIPESDGNQFALTFSEVILFSSLTINNRNKEIHFIPKELLSHSFIDKMLILEKLDFSLSFISEKILQRNNHIYSVIILLYIYFTRALRLLKQGILLKRLKGYIKYIFNYIYFIESE